MQITNAHNEDLARERAPERLVRESFHAHFDTLSDIPRETLIEKC